MIPFAMPSLQLIPIYDALQLTCKRIRSIRRVVNISTIQVLALSASKLILTPSCSLAAIATSKVAKNCSLLPIIQSPIFMRNLVILAPIRYVPFLILLEQIITPKFPPFAKWLSRSPAHLDLSHWLD